MTDNNAKHTPGPWTTETLAHGFVGAGNILIASEGEVVEIATINPHTMDPDEATANAALIARAPDLLAEVEKLRATQAGLVGALEYMLKATPASSRRGTRVEDCHAIARAALAKAKQA